MIYPYEKCEGYKLYGDDFLPIYGLCREYKDLTTYLKKKTKHFQITILRLGSELTDQDRADYTLIYKDLAAKLETLHKERLELEHEIGTSFDQLLLQKIAVYNGTVRHESNRHHRSNKGNC